MSITATTKTKVRHRNGINRTFAEMPLNARRVLFCVMAQIDSKKTIGAGSVFEITASEFSTICDINIDTAYTQLKDGAELLQQQVIRIPVSELLEPIGRVGERTWQKKNSDKLVSMNITAACSYSEGDAVVEVEFSRRMEPYICKLERDYTTQVLLSSVRLTESNASCMYQYLRSKISNGKPSYFDIEIEKLKEDLGADKQDTYSEFKYFKRDFFKRAANQIVSKTEFKTIEMIVTERVKRKISKVRIFYTYENY